MADDDRPTDDLTPKRRGKTPTITLKAQEIDETPATQGAASPAPSAGPEAEASPAAEEVSPPAAPAEVAAAADPAPAEGEGPLPASEAAAGAGNAEAPPAGTDEAPHEPAVAVTPPSAAPPPAETARPAGGPGFGRLAAAGLIGALLTGGLGFAVDRTGLLAGRADDNRAALEQRIAALDAEIRQLAARPAPQAPAPAEPVDLNPLNRRIDDLDAARAALQSRLAEVEKRPAPAQDDTVPPMDLAPLKVEIDALKVAVEAVAAAQRLALAAAPPAPAEPDPAAIDARVGALLGPLGGRLEAVSGQVAGLGTRIEALETGSKAASDAARAGTERLAALESARKEAGESGRRAALVVGIGALRAAVERGQPFSAELRSAVALGLPAAAARTLEAPAERGLTTTPALARRFATLAPAMVRAAPGRPAGEGLLDRLSATAQSLVRIRPVGEAAGDDAPTVVARIEAKLSRGDLAGALADFDRLPESARAVGASWAADARARAEAEAALRQLSVEAAAALGGG